MWLDQLRATATSAGELVSAGHPAWTRALFVRLSSWLSTVDVATEVLADVLPDMAADADACSTWPVRGTATLSSRAVARTRTGLVRDHVT
jgi:hypothetical protein